MTDNAVPDIEEFYRQQFPVYSPEGLVGAACDGRGRVSAIMLEEDALRAGDEALADEIVALAQLARAKYRMNLRLFSLDSLAAQGRDTTPMDRFYRRVQKLPTPEEYTELQAKEFARRYQ